MWGLIFTSVAQVALSVVVATLDVAPPSPPTVTPTLHLNGYDVVPSSPEIITSFYGRWMSLPGAPGLIQGNQEFDVVDPTSGETVGTFDALVSKGDGYNYTALLVTANDGTNVGTTAGEVPPVGSLITTFKIGRFGLFYSAMPSPTGDVVSFKLLTPFGDFPLPMAFDGAAGIADHTVDNRPINLNNGYSIAPASPLAETIIATSGVLPFFATVQGHQVFSVYDSDGNAVGSFDGVFTTTSDIIINYTQAILVTGNDGMNVGTEPGQVPPVGSVYNICYSADDDHYLLYSSLPSPSGDVISLIQVGPEGVTENDLTFLNASRSPDFPTPSAPGGNSFVATSPLTPSGINGLPPREVQIQGYQQFELQDSTGAPLGSFDADVATQWDLLGIKSNAILITNVTNGTVGSDPGDVPPVGSIFNYVYFGDSGFGTYYSVVPEGSGDVMTFKLVTPWGNIQLYSIYHDSPTRTDGSFFNPFTTV